ncbi:MULTISPECIES: phosphoserine phosphatase SerB [Caulobacter]|jgi:phosphoserine phosphatase|uniref:Phosphoserine phosphatase n=1 Tax=Caulobacter rhizosphaerae TaxID=2010972 RepID=A0ABU1MZP6_9CAUL|nr:MULTISPECIES: phosphoserine phosphatase SerB [Caulobacter]KQZ18254.1 phosphoserine phosphatase [Caulobacter sp. Root1472]MDR6531650.1 phosphoserine phosphatase [Caulobacter rhizosphaerae]
MLAITLVSPDPAALAQAAAVVRAAVAITSDIPLGEGALDLLADSPPVETHQAVKATVGDLPVDFAVQPVENRRKRLLIADMDSTIINVECLDELADFAGVKDKVSEITERAMRGELAFEGALRERVGMLKGLSVDALQACYDDRVKLNPGARTLVRTMAAHGARCALVSGGFTFFTSRVADAAGFHLNRANTLIEAGGLLTGTVGDPILGKEAKLAALREETAALGLTPADALAVGDGANDLAMIEAAGLGVAYRAKPIVAAQAHAKVDHADLTALLYFQGYTAAEFAS